jgi:hypothetical protein
MLGVSTTAATPFEAVLASRVAGDRDDLLSYIKAAIRAGAAIVLLSDPVMHPSDDPKKPKDFRTERMTRADVTSGTTPVDSSGKALRSWYAAITTESRAQALWERATSDGSTPNVGINLGRSGLIVVDCDNAGDVEAFTAWWQEEFPAAPVPRVTVRSPGKQNDDGSWGHSGGGHIYLWVPEGVDANELPILKERLSEAEKKEQRRDGWVAMTGDGKGVLIPPSLRNEGAYTYSGHPIAIAPMKLIEMLLERRAATLTDGTDSRDAGLAAWEDATSWESLLTPRGWSYTGKTDPCGCPTWTRPGKGVRGAKSAVAHEVNCGALSASHKVGALHLFTDAGPSELDGEKTFSKIAFVAKMNGWTIPNARRQLGIPPAQWSVVTFPEGAPWGMSTWHVAPDDENPSETDDDGKPEAQDSTETDADSSRTDGDPGPRAEAEEEDFDDSTIDSHPDAPQPFIVTITLPDGSETTVNLGHQTITSQGIVDEPYADPTSPFGVKPINDRILAEMEEDFFSGHPALRRIHAEARLSDNDPWALVACTLNNALSHVPPHHVLPTKTGQVPSTVARGGSLNNAVYLPAPSTAGKSDVADQASEILPPKDTRGLGSQTGQNLLREFAEVRERREGEGKDKVTVSELVRVRESVSLLIQEATQLFAEGDRAASPTFSILRQALFGQNVSNATSDRRRYGMLRAGSYRFTMTVLAQPSTLGPLFTAAEIGGGTTGRNLFVPVAAGCQFASPSSWRGNPLPEVPVFKAGFPSDVQPPPLESDAGVHDTILVMDPVVIPRSAGAERYLTLMNATRRALVRATIAEGITPAEQARINDALVAFHMPIMWLRLEAAFAIIFGAVDADGVIRPDLDPRCAIYADKLTRIHKGTLAYCWKAVQAAEVVEAQKEGDLIGHRQDAADNQRARLTAKRRKALERRVVKYIAKAGGQAVKSKISTGVFSSRDRSLMDGIMAELVDMEVLEFDGTYYRLRGK